MRTPVTAALSNLVGATRTQTVRLKSPRPTLTAATAVAYLDWVLENAAALKGDVQLHMAAAELAIRTRANEAQAKDTQHTLVRDGAIDPPPTAS